MNYNFKVYPIKKRENLFWLWIRNLNVTTIIIFLNIIFFLFFLIFNSVYPNLINYFAIQPQTFMNGQNLWTIITSMFMHAGFFHLFINMFVLFSMGRLCEKIIGRKRFFWFYILSGIFAGLLFVTLAYYFGDSSMGARIFGASTDYAVGASGAIFGIAALFMILIPKMRFSIIFLPFFSLPGYIMIPLVLFATWIVSSSANFGIGNTAHLGGFLFGILYGTYLRKKYPKKINTLSKFFR